MAKEAVSQHKAMAMGKGAAKPDTTKMVQKKAGGLVKKLGAPKKSASKC